MGDFALLVSGLLFREDVGGVLCSVRSADTFPLALFFSVGRYSLPRPAVFLQRGEGR